MTKGSAPIHQRLTYRQDPTLDAAVEFHPSASLRAELLRPERAKMRHPADFAAASERFKMFGVASGGAFEEGEGMSKSTYPLKLPTSIKKAAQRLAREDGVSLNQWIAAAVAEKVGVVETAADFFKKRAGKGTGEGMMKFLRTAPKSAPEQDDVVYSEFSNDATKSRLRGGNEEEFKSALEELFDQAGKSRVQESDGYLSATARCISIDIDNQCDRC